MRILLITETPPYPLDSGGRIKTFNTICMLGHSHEIHVHALARSLSPVPDALARCASVTLHPVERGITQGGRSAARALGRGWPLTVARHVDTHAGEAIARAIDRLKPDLLYVDHLSMMAYVMRAPGSFLPPVLYDAHNVEHRLLARYAGTQSGPARWAAQTEARRVRRFETAACQRADGVLAVSDVDGTAIAELAGTPAKVRVVPIALDLTMTPPIVRLTERPQMLYVGGLHWPPNRDAVEVFTREALPLIRRDVPEAELVIVGRADRRSAKTIGRRPGVRLPGAVENLTDVVAASRLLVVPLRSGSGTRVKILDAFARGLPVVSTPLGHEGLGVTDGIELLSATRASDFAAAVVRVLRDHALADRLREAGLQYVRRHHGVPAVIPRLASAVEETARCRRGAGTIS